MELAITHLDVSNAMVASLVSMYYIVPQDRLEAMISLGLGASPSNLTRALLSLDYGEAIRLFHSTSGSFLYLVCHAS